jgi:hypothetical protein
MLIILHVLCRWPLVFHPSPAEFVFSLTSILQFAQNNSLQITIILTVVMIGLKYLIFYKDIDEAFELRCTYIEELNRKFEERGEEGGDQVTF